MAAINDLISQIQDETLRNRIQEEVSKMVKQKKFGLVFEEHMPESTPLYDMPIKRGCNVMRRDSKDDKSIYVVLRAEGDTAVCVKPEQKDEAVTFEQKDIVRVAEFGESIYPYLKPLDSVCNAPDSDLWHTLIEADNYHALQLLEYLYAGKVDCIYIDPPYNTGTDDWKYNDAFVDASDHWSHSKWLSFMKKRLLLSKKILSKNGKIVISIGYQELHRLCLLCEELFPDKQVVPVTVQTSGGKPSGGFNYLQEYLVFIVNQNFKSYKLNFNGRKTRSPFEGMTLATFTQAQRPNQTYPVYVRKSDGFLVGCGKSLADRVSSGLYSGELADFEFDFNEAPEGTDAVWPITSKGDKCVWRLISKRLLEDYQKGYIKISPTKSPKNKNLWSIQYLPEGIIKKVEDGTLEILGHEGNLPTLILGENETSGTDIPTIWIEKEFYTTKGTAQIQSIFGSKEFPYPKPLALVTEILRACTNKNSIVLDFFAGSGTTLNAVNLLNKQDDGNRLCIMVTNNELSKKQVKTLEKSGIKPGDELWNAHGICRAVTWPRTVYTITGKGANGELLDGKYNFFDDEDYLMRDGFKANCEYFRLGFLDPTVVSLGMRFSEMLPTLWLKTGAKGKCPELNGEQVPDMLILPENQFAVLINENTFADFAEKLAEHPEIQTVFLATDYEVNYQSMVKNLNVTEAYQLYRDYLDHFRVNRGRN